MRDLLPGFYKRTDEELSKLWQEGTFVLDTNMLLNVYRYTQKTRDRYFEILDLLKNRNQLWIPYQAAYEYQDRRMDVIQGQLDAYTEVASILQTAWQKLERSLEPYKSKHGFIDANKLTEEITDAIKKAKATVTQGKGKDKREYEALKKHDRLLEKLEELFQGNIGDPYEWIKLEEIYKQAQLRVELKIPPGWEDEGKKSYRVYGDVLLWFQLMDFAREKKKPIIFVTDDGKKDWWLAEAKSQERDRPLPELVQEMFVEAHVLLHMYQGYQFLQEAERFLKLEKKPDVVEEAKEVTQQNIVELDQARTASNIKQRAQLFEQAVLDWLPLIYPEGKIRGNTVVGPDFVISEPNGSKIGVEVKYRSKTYTYSDIEFIIQLVNKELSKNHYDKFILFLVCSELQHAHDLANKIRFMKDRFETITVIVGWLEPDGRFAEYETFS